MKTHYEKLKKKYHKLTQYNNFIEVLDHCQKDYPNKVAFKLKDKNKMIYDVTYKQFVEDVKAMATYLLSKNMRNRKIAVIGKNSYNWCVSYMAASIVGIVVPLDKELKIDEIINFINVSDSKAVISDSKYIEELRKEENLQKLNNKNITYINMDNSNILKISNFEDALKTGHQLYDSGDKRCDEIKIGIDELKILLFTSGTTGNAKAVKLSQFNVLADVVATGSIVKSKKDDLFLSILPIHHTYECTLGFLLPIYNGSTIAFCEGLRYISNNINEFKPTIVLVVPLLLENVYDKIIKNMNKSLPKKYQKPGENPYPSLPFFLKPIVKKRVRKQLGGRIRYFIVGAASMEPNIIKGLDELGLNTLQGYGLTECAPLVAGNSDFFKKLDAVGLPIKGVDIRILNPNEEGVGEILVKGPNVMLGYYNNEEETNKVLKDGWFYTGDLGRLDENGYLYITGRCKSVIVTKNGKNIYPEEVEHYLNESPIIAESLVEGISEDDDNDPYIAAQVYPNPEAIKEYFKGKIPTKEQLQELISNIVSSVNKKLPNYKHIKKFTVRDKEFEKTTTQKVKRHGTNLSNNNVKANNTAKTEEPKTENIEQNKATASNESSENAKSKNTDSATLKKQNSKKQNKKK